MKKAIQGHEDQWAVALKWACMQYNISYNSTIGMTPYYATYGREPSTALSTLIAAPPAEDESMDITGLVNRIERIDAAIKKGTDALEASYGVRNAELRRTQSFDIGDLVYVHRVYPESFVAAGIDTKFWMPFRPELYVVLEKRSVRIYRVRRADNLNDKTMDIHVQRLKAYEPRENALKFEDFARKTEK